MSDEEEKLRPYEDYLDHDNPWRAERTNRLRLAAGSIRYNIAFLDEALGGIMPNDLVVFGAGTGIGKTQLAAALALSAISQGRQVLLYALEAGHLEIHSRIKYMRIAEYFYSHRSEFPSNVHLNYFDWHRGKLDNVFDVLEYKIADELKSELALLQILSPTHGDFSARTITSLTKEWSSASLVLLDHLHKLNLEEEVTENKKTQFVPENIGIKRAVSELRDFVNTHETPVIAFSHLRKATFSNKMIIPTIEELHGSSEISKQANAVVTFAKARRVVDKEKNEFKLTPGHTFVRINKARNGADACTHYAAIMMYDLGRHAYSPGYIPCECDYWATEVTPLKSKAELAHWMENAQIFQERNSFIQPPRQRNYEAGTADD